MSVLVASKWKRAMTAPSNSVPLPVLIVAGENAFQTIVSQMLVAINREILKIGFVNGHTYIFLNQKQIKSDLFR